MRLGAKQAAERFVAEHPGVRIFPMEVDVVNEKKVPLVTAWQRSASADPSSFSEDLWRRADGYGVVPEGFTILDFDSHAALVQFVNEIGEAARNVDTMIVDTPRGGLHMWFRGETVHKNALEHKLDVRSGAKGYIVGPGSLNPTDGREWEPRADDWHIQTLPPSVRDYIMGRQREKEERKEALRTESSWSAGEMGRNDMLSALKGLLMGKAGMSDEEANTLVREANQRFDEPLSESELESTVLRAKDWDVELVMRVEKALRDDDFLDIEQVLAMPPPKYVITDVWPEGGVNVLYGPPGCGKSFLALDWSLHRSCGMDWFGRKVKPAVSRQGEKQLVLYVAAEGAYGFGTRLRAWLQARGVSADSEAYSAILRTWRMYPHAINLTREEDLSRLRTYIAEEGIGLVIVDTLRKSMTGADENSAMDVGKLMSALEQLATMFDCDSLVVHHGGKGEGGNYRGSSAIEGDAYNMWKMKPLGSSSREEIRAKLTTHKFKDAPPVELEIRMTTFGDSLAVSEIVDPEQTLRDMKETTENLRKAAPYDPSTDEGYERFCNELEEMFGAGGGEWPSQNAFAKACGWHRSQLEDEPKSDAPHPKFTAAVKRLEEDGWVEVHFVKEGVKNGPKRIVWAGRPQP